MSDAEEDDYNRAKMTRKVEMLSVNNFDDEYFIKTAYNRKKSADYFKEY